MEESYRERIASDRARALAEAPDEVTGLGSRPCFEYLLGGELVRAARRSSPLTALKVEVNEFRTYNATHGSAAGEEVLRTIAHLLSSDVRSDDVVCRYGDDNFTVLLPNTRPERASLMPSAYFNRYFGRHGRINRSR